MGNCTSKNTSGVTRAHTHEPFGGTAVDDPQLQPQQAEEAPLAEEAREAEDAPEAEEAPLGEEAREAEDTPEAEMAPLAEEAREAEDAPAAEKAPLAEEDPGLQPHQPRPEEPPHAPFADSLEALMDAGRRLMGAKRIVPLSVLHHSHEKTVLCAAVLPAQHGGVVVSPSAAAVAVAATPVDVLRLAAVKMVRKAPGDSPVDLIAALRGEAEMLVSLHDSPRVAHALAYMEDAGADGPWAALLTEYAEGGDLTKTDFFANLSVSTVHRLACQLCDVLEHPVLSKHRDLIPRNVVLVVDRDAQVQLKVVDWETVAPVTPAMTVSAIPHGSGPERSPAEPEAATESAATESAAPEAEVASEPAPVSDDLERAAPARSTHTGATVAATPSSRGSHVSSLAGNSGAPSLQGSDRASPQGSQVSSLASATNGNSASPSLQGSEGASQSAAAVVRPAVVTSWTVEPAVVGAETPLSQTSVVPGLTPDVRDTVAALLALLDPSTLRIADGSGGGNALKAAMEHPATTLSDFVEGVRSVEVACLPASPSEIRVVRLVSNAALSEFQSKTGLAEPQAVALQQWMTEHRALPRVRDGVVVGVEGTRASVTATVAHLLPFCFGETLAAADSSPPSADDVGVFPDNTRALVAKYLRVQAASRGPRPTLSHEALAAVPHANQRPRLVTVCERYLKAAQSMNARGKLRLRPMVELLLSDSSDGRAGMPKQSAAVLRWLEAARDDTARQLMLWMLYGAELTEVCVLLELDAASAAATPVREVPSCLTTWLNSDAMVTAVAELLAAVWEAEVAKAQSASAAASASASASAAVAAAALPPARVTWTRERHAALVREFTEGALWALAVPRASYQGMTLPCGAVVLNTASFATDFTRGVCPPTATVVQCRMALTAVHEFGHFARVRVMGPKTRTPPMALPASAPQRPGPDLTPKPEAGLAMERALVQGGAACDLPALWPDTEADAARMLAWGGVGAFPHAQQRDSDGSTPGGARPSPRRRVTIVTPAPTPAMSDEDGGE